MLSELTPVLTDAFRRILDDSVELCCAGDKSLTQVERGASSKQFDALLLGAANPAAIEPSGRLLEQNPLLKIVCVSPDAREAVLQERRLHCSRIENVSVDRIFSALRDACAREGLG